MTYEVLYRLPNGDLMAVTVKAANDSELMHNALRLLPQGAAIEDAELPEAA